MNLLDVMMILKPWQDVEIRKDEYSEGEKKEVIIYKGKVSGYDPKVSEVREYKVEMVYCGYYDTISITLKG